jgi:hypothetical protein
MRWIQRNELLLMCEKTLEPTDFVPFFTSSGSEIHLTKQRILRYFGENIMSKIKLLKSVLHFQLWAHSLSARQWAKRVFNSCALKVMCLPTSNQLLLTRHTWSCYLSSETLSPCLLSFTQVLSPKRVTKYRMLHLTPSRIIILRPFTPDTPTGRDWHASKHTALEDKTKPKYHFLPPGTDCKRKLILSYLWWNTSLVSEKVCNA